MTERSTIGITMGDAAGIGPEIIVKALSEKELYDTARIVVIGDVDRLRAAARLSGQSIAIESVGSVDEASSDAGTISVIDVPGLPADVPFGEVSAAAGDAAYRYLVRAVELASGGGIGAICTAPINKRALQDAGHMYAGHTELLAELTGTDEVSMMLQTPQLRVIHVTTHVGLREAIGIIDPGLVERTIKRGYDALRAAGVEEPRIGVCALNPHAGEGGLFGDREEEEKILPGILAARASGIDATGPVPADTAFYRAVRGDFDLMVAMYHDQGHVPIKVMGIEAGVNITVGLPVVRTSVDHGTAFDIAGTGAADERGMVEAIRQAISLARKGGS